MKNKRGIYKKKKIDGFLSCYLAIVINLLCLFWNFTFIYIDINTFSIYFAVSNSQKWE